MVNRKILAALFLILPRAFAQESKPIDTLREKAYRNRLDFFVEMATDKDVTLSKVVYVSGTDGRDKEKSLMISTDAAATVCKIIFGDDSKLVDVEGQSPKDKYIVEYDPESRKASSHRIRGTDSVIQAIEYLTCSYSGNLFE